MCAPYLIAQLDDTRNAFSHFGFSLFIVCLVVYLLFWLYVYSRSRSTIEARSKKEEKKIFDWMKLNIQSTTCLSTSNSMNIKPYAWITPRWALVALQVDRCVTRADKLLRSVFIYIVSNLFFLFSIFSKFFFYFVHVHLLIFASPKIEMEIEIERQIERYEYRFQSGLLQIAKVAGSC